MKQRKQFKIQQIGHIDRKNGIIKAIINEEFKGAIKGLNEFSHIKILFWADKLDTPQMRKILVTNPRYAPHKNMGIFATRSPVRPNPILVTTCKIIDINEEEGVIIIQNIDAENQTPILDIKPYIPCQDLVLNVKIPEDVPQEFIEPIPEEGVHLREKK